MHAYWNENERMKWENDKKTKIMKAQEKKSQKWWDNTCILQHAKLEDEILDLKNVLKQKLSILHTLITAILSTIFICSSETLLEDMAQISM